MHWSFNNFLNGILKKPKKSKKQIYRHSFGYTNMIACCRSVVSFLKLLKRVQPSLGISHLRSCTKLRLAKPVELGWVSLFNGISTFVGYLMPKPFS